MLTAEDGGAANRKEGAADPALGAWAIAVSTYVVRDGRAGLKHKP